MQVEQPAFLRVAEGLRTILRGVLHASYTRAFCAKRVRIGVPDVALNA
ncbi:hypothetical protein [Paraburkholderia sp. BL27I4N3]|nr:hypothetical protein [Paraburkholderia sp. BL27I4N3]